MKFTVVGSTGFIGGALAEALAERGFGVEKPLRGSTGWMDGDLGHVIYAAGVTADFLRRPFDTIEANTCLVAELLRHGRFESLLYLSSSRVYRRGASSQEDSPVMVCPGDPDDLYDLSKLAGEAICRASGRRHVRVARLSNVVGRDFGSENFLFQMIRGACNDGRIALRTALDSEKDYVRLDDIVPLLIDIATRGRHACYNVGAGANLTHRELLTPILATTGARLEVAVDAPLLRAPVLDVSRVQDEFGFRARSVLDLIPQLIHEYRTSGA